MLNDARVPITTHDEGTWLRDAALVVLFGALLIAPSFFTRDLWNPDEPRYLEVAREMVVRGDYLVPHLDNVIYPDKPPMFFWLTAGLYNLGVGNIAGRVVAGLATIGTLLLTYAFGRRKFGSRTGLLAALVTATILLFFGMLKPGVIDPLLTFLESGAILAGYCALTGAAPRSRHWWLAFYAACALAILTKGPVGLLVPGLVLLAFALFNRKTISGGGWMHAAGAALMLYLFGAWLLPAMMRGGPEYARAILGMPVNYTTATANHAHGPQYYVLQLPAYLLPWAFIFVLALAQALLDWRRKGDRDAAFLSLWFLCVLAFFTAVSAKRERYLLPLTPAVGLLCARYFMLTARNGIPWPRLHRFFSAALFVIFGLIGIFLGLIPFVGEHIARTLLQSQDPEMLSKVLDILGKSFMMMTLPAGLLVLAVSVIGLTVARNRRGWLIGSSMGIIVALSLFMDLALMPALNPVKSSKLFCQRVLPYLLEADKRYLFANDYSGVINLHTGILDIPMIQVPAHRGKGETRDRRKTERNALMIALLTKTFSQPGKIAVISDEKQVAGFVEQMPPNVRIIARERVGHRGMICLANWGEENGNEGEPQMNTDAH